MAGLYTLSNNGVKMSIGELDRLMDEAAGINAGKMTPIQAMTVPLAFRAVDMIAGAVSRMPYYIEDSAENDVTDESTPRYWSELMYKLTASLLLFNGAYCLKESNQFGLNSRYRFLPSPLVRWDTNKGEITRFEYCVDGVWTNIPNFEKSLLWWWWPNLTSEVGPGVGPMNAALQDIGLASSLTHFAESYFSRGGFPLTILSTEGNISEPEKVLSWWNAMVRGARQAFKAILLTNKITPTVIGSNIKDTIAPELYSQAAHNVAIAFGIPLSLLLSDAANYATALGDHVRFYTETVIPLAERIFEQWNERVYEPQGLEIECDPSQLEIMQAYQLETAAAVVAVVGKPVLTVDEGREILGYDPMGDDALDEPQEAQPVAEQPATTEPVTEVPDETQDDAIETERKALRRYAHNRLRDGKPFAFRSDVIGLPEIEAIKSCATHEAIDALDLANVKMEKYFPSNGYTELVDAINSARIELRNAIKYSDEQPRDENGMWTDGGGLSMNPKKIEPVNAITNKKKFKNLVKDMKERGWNGPPVLAYKDGETLRAVTGSHRIYAAREAGIDVPVSTLEFNGAQYEDIEGFINAKRDEDVLRVFDENDYVGRGFITKKQREIMKREVDNND